MRGFLVLLTYFAAVAAAMHAASHGTPRPPWREPAVWLAALALVLHGAWLVAALGPAGELTLGLSDSASLMGLAIGAGGLIALSAARFQGVAACVLVLAALCATGTGAPADVREVAAPGLPLAAHVLLAMASAGLFAIAAVFVVLLAAQDAALRDARPRAWLSWMPPVESLERALFAVIAAGLTALSIAILAGFLFVTDLFAQHLVHKTVLALAAWLIFATLLLGRWRFGWRGRKAARYTIAGFIVLALAYFGSKFVLEILLGRHWG